MKKDTASFGAKVNKIFKKAVKSEQANNSAKGIPNVFSRDSKLYMELNGQVMPYDPHVSKITPSKQSSQTPRKKSA